MNAAWDDDLRRAAVERGAALTRRAIALMGLPFKQEEETRHVDRLMDDAVSVLKALQLSKEAPRDLRALERDRMRPLVLELRRYGLRRHLGCAAPHWGPPVTPQPNAYAYFGRPDLMARLAPLAGLLGLEPVQPAGVGAADAERWNVVCAANIVVLDFRTAARAAGTWPSTAHALGLALVAGTMPVVVRDEGPLPFDVHLTPLDLPPREQGDSALLHAIAAAALASFQVPSVDDSTKITLDHVVELVGNGHVATRFLRAGLDELRAQQTPDPLLARLRLRSLLDATQNRSLALLTPLWPFSYPNPRQPSCFHVLPFALPASVSNAVREACGDDMQYQRGDSTGSIDIVEGFWHAIARASHVVVDLSALEPYGPGERAVPNTNVCLELALAQALGRRLLLVRSAACKDAPLFTGIDKLQVLPYESAAGLRGIARRFLQRDGDQASPGVERRPAWRGLRGAG